MQTEDTLQKIIKMLVQDGYRLQVTRRIVEQAIMKLRGIDERTIKKWLKALMVFEYLTPISPNVYRINPLKVPELFPLLKEKPQTKIA
ncbi:MAG: hypothetical protein ACOWW1_10285 [archaeon]